MEIMMETEMVIGVLFLVTTVVSFLIGRSFGEAEGRSQGIDYALKVFERGGDL